VGAEVGNLMPFAAQPVGEQRLQVGGGMVGCNGDAHGASPAGALRESDERALGEAPRIGHKRLRLFRRYFVTKRV
jgi:hypothetical protein